VGLEGELGAQGRLVRGINAREALDEALRHLGVQALRVARLDDVKGDVEEDLGVELR
jgi:hypothetical protein